jgi:hypothetical protein
MKAALNLFIWRCATEHSFMPLVILHHLLSVFVQLANKRGLKKYEEVGDAYCVGLISKS